MRFHKAHTNFCFCNVFVYVPKMQITQKVCGRGAGTNLNSGHTTVSRDLPLGARVGWRWLRKRLGFELETVNPLQEASLWVLSASGSFTSRFISIADVDRAISV